MWHNDAPVDTVPQNTLTDLYTEKAIEFTIRVCGISAIIFVFSIFIFVYKEAHPFIWRHLDIAEFFGTIAWRPLPEEDPCP